MSTAPDFYTTLFDTEQWAAFQLTPDQRRPLILRPDQVANNDRAKSSNYFCINGIYPNRDLQPYRDWHHPKKPRRAEVNVPIFRNLLQEKDDRPIKEQLYYYRNIGIPFTSMVFSGSGSIHLIISLIDPLPSVAHYKRLWTAIFNELGGEAAGCDKATKNPAWLSRNPGAVRINDDGTKAIQELIELRERVGLDEVLAWLGISAEKLFHFPPPTQPRIIVSGDPLAGLTDFDRAFLMYGAPPKKWNPRLFNCSLHFFQGGGTIEHLCVLIGAIPGCTPPDTEDLKTIRSAQRYVEFNLTAQYAQKEIL